MQFTYQKAILYISSFIKNSLVLDHKRRLPFQTGIFITKIHFLDLYEYLNNSHNFQFIMTFKLNQEVLKDVFFHSKYT